MWNLTTINVPHMVSVQPLYFISIVKLWNIVCDVALPRNFISSKISLSPFGYQFWYKLMWTWFYCGTSHRIAHVIIGNSYFLALICIFNFVHFFYSFGWMPCMGLSVFFMSSFFSSQNQSKYSCTKEEFKPQHCIQKC